MPRMHIPRTDRTLLLDRILRDSERGDLGEGLDAVVAHLRQSGLGARPIAERLTHYTGVPVSYRTVARWLREQDEVAA